jgi:putative toxin-antitoxin system antitoxin component (TIGR02293 family)
MNQSVRDFRGILSISSNVLKWRNNLAFCQVGLRDSGNAVSSSKCGWRLGWVVPRHLSRYNRQMTSTIFKSYPLENDLEMASLILAGLPTAVLRKVAAFLGLRPAKVGSLVNINEKTLERRLKAHARLKPDESERVARLMRIISLAASVLESEAHAREWLNRPLRELGGRTPLQMTATEPGAREVERVLGRIEHGIFG